MRLGRYVLTSVVSHTETLQWDLGEFDQKGTVATKWGTKDELLKAIATARAHGIDVLIDAVLNVCPSPTATRHD